MEYHFKVESLLLTNMPMKLEQVVDSNMCWLCEKEFLPVEEDLQGDTEAEKAKKAKKREEEKKVRDHDRFTGNFRGMAHNKCNLLAKQQKTINVIVHNLKAYDSAFIFNIIDKFWPQIQPLIFPMKDPTKPPTIDDAFKKLIMRNMEKPLTFIDSLDFFQ